MPIFNDIHVGVDRAEALAVIRRRQAVPRSEAVPTGRQAWLEAVDRVVAEAPRLVRPAVAYVVLPVTSTEPSRLIVGDGHALESAVVASLFAEALEVVLMLFTIGPLLEQRVTSLEEAGDYPSAFALDIIGSAMLGQTGEVGYGIIEEMAKVKGTKASIPLNPGTSHWPMSGQRLIARLVDAQAIGVKALESGVLRPFKSIAFAVALGDHVLTPAEASSCDYCDNRDLCRP